ncbi:flavin reductase family protein [Paenibacillus zeisoli]|uniref:Flavin reductase family protein n=1 Tax=Paenibacillus zeisoli TaxID=2496267 RepID=A0A3S1D9G3_9BACL|nr:flavin reductase family protein [Paenibacillus zeisoli]RUT31856.1 flavin reductase family protein [Paenibacillus zeisoli]
MKTITINPSILYYGTPVILLNTLNEDRSVNISPISSSWALGYSIVLGLGVSGKAFENLQKHPECVINVPGPSLWEHVERLAPFTGKESVPQDKKDMGFTYEKDKYSASGLTPVQSLSVQPDRIAECPIQLEAKVKHIRVPDDQPIFAIVETEVLQVHVHEEIILEQNYIDPNKWSPLIYNFRHYFGLGQPLGKSFRAKV